MGKGGRSASTKEQWASSWKSSYNPTDKSVKLPSKGQIKASIPKECFKRSALHSMYFVFRDSAMAAALVYATNQALSTKLPENLLSVDALYWFLGWNFYAFWMGTILTGHWVLAHECGHGAFSDSQTFNDVVGFIIHQAQLVPYFAWQYTHAKHHRRTNHLTDGESHVPTTGIENGLGPNNERLSFYATLHESIGDDAFAVWEIFSHVVLGWPLYLLGLASTGRMGSDGTFLKEGEIIDHFRPSSKMFADKVRFKILISTLTELGVLGLLLKLSLDYGFLTVTLWYTGPYLWTNFWLVLYTWLQHSDPSVPQYGPEEWTWVKGALSTIDRPYGIFDFFHHKIGSTHVAHHLFHEMPFYKADVATAAIKEYLGPLYNYDPTPWYVACWKIAKTCHYVEDFNGIQYYKSLEDIPLSKNLKKA
jgi:fatty acid desaturase